MIKKILVSAVSSAVPHRACEPARMSQKPLAPTKNLTGSSSQAPTRDPEIVSQPAPPSAAVPQYPDYEPYPRRTCRFYITGFVCVESQLSVFFLEFGVPNISLIGSAFSFPIPPHNFFKFLHYPHPPFPVFNQQPQPPSPTQPGELPAQHSGTSLDKDMRLVHSPKISYFHSIGSTLLNFLTPSFLNLPYSVFRERIPFQNPITKEVVLF